MESWLAALVRPRLGTCVLDLAVRYLARNYFYKRLTIFDANGSETSSGRKKTTEVSFDCRLQVQHFLNRVKACSAECLEEGIRGHGPCVPVSRLYFIKRISDASVIAAAACPNNFQTLVSLSQCNQVRSHLVLDSRPHFV